MFEAPRIGVLVSIGIGVSAIVNLFVGNWLLAGILFAEAGLGLSITHDYRRINGSNRRTQARRGYSHPQTTFRPDNPNQTFAAERAIEALAHALCTGTKAYTGPRLGRYPHNRESMPILAGRMAYLVVLDGKVKFMSVSQREYFGLEADAHCTLDPSTSKHLHNDRRRRLPCPAPDCTCGFYAVPIDKAGGYANAVLLEVELSGRVIIHGKGYRAGHQSIVGVKIPRSNCGHPTTSVVIPSFPAGASNFDLIYYSRQARYECGQELEPSTIPTFGERDLRLTWATTAAVPISRTWIEDQIKPSYTPNGVEYTLGELQEALGVSVTPL